MLGQPLIHARLERFELCPCVVDFTENVFSFMYDLSLGEDHVTNQYWYTTPTRERTIAAGTGATGASQDEVDHIVLGLHDG